MGDALLPSRYRYLAVEAWQRGDLSEGQLAGLLQVDRLTARRMIRDNGLDSSFDLSAPLVAVGAG